MNALLQCNAMIFFLDCFALWWRLEKPQVASELDSLQNYDEAIKTDPSSSRAHMGRGKALLALGRLQEATSAWQSVVDNFGPLDDLEVVENAMNYIRAPELCSSTRNSPRQSNSKQSSPRQAQVRFLSITLTETLTDLDLHNASLQFLLIFLIAVHTLQHAASASRDVASECMVSANHQMG